MKTLTRDQLKDMLDIKYDMLLVNVLSYDQYEKAHIPYSVNVPLNSGEFIERVDELAGRRDKRIVTYCSNVKCTASTDAAKRLAEAGFSDVCVYQGGIEDWIRAKYRVEGRMRQAA